jgi:GNAT superfamily N-acetyltransferase
MTTDVPRITRLVNEAFRVEDFFKAGDRTDESEVESLMGSGEFLLLDEVDPASQRIALSACVYLERVPPVAYLGMLSISPQRQKCGLGRQMMRAAEEHCRVTGCVDLEIHVVNLRDDLMPFYRQGGFVETGVLPFPDDGSATRPCHFVVMRKRIG